MSSLSVDDQAVLKAFLSLGKTSAASVQFHSLVTASRLPTRDVIRSLATLRQLGYIAELRTYGPGRRLHPVTGDPA